MADEKAEKPAPEKGEKKKSFSKGLFGSLWRGVKKTVAENAAPENSEETTQRPRLDSEPPKPAEPKVNDAAPAAGNNAPSVGGFMDTLKQSPWKELLGGGGLAVIGLLLGNFLDLGGIATLLMTGALAAAGTAGVHYLLPETNADTPLVDNGLAQKKGVAKTVEELTEEQKKTYEEKIRKLAAAPRTKREAPVHDDKGNITTRMGEDVYLIISPDVKLRLAADKDTFIEVPFSGTTATTQGMQSAMEEQLKKLSPEKQAMMMDKMKSPEFTTMFDNFDAKKMKPDAAGNINVTLGGGASITGKLEQTIRVYLDKDTYVDRAFPGKGKEELELPDEMKAYYTAEEKKRIEQIYASVSTDIEKEKLVKIHRQDEKVALEYASGFALEGKIENGELLIYGNCIPVPQKNALSQVYQTPIKVKGAVNPDGSLKPLDEMNKIIKKSAHPDAGTDGKTGFNPLPKTDDKLESLAQAFNSGAFDDMPLERQGGRRASLSSEAGLQV